VRSTSPFATPILAPSELLQASPASPPPGPPESPPSETPPAISATSPPSPRATPTPAPADIGSDVPTDSSIPIAPPMSKYFPSCPFKVLCRYCHRDDHDIRYRQCPSCYKKRGGTNYFGW
jgi:hypothetical protein